jgi:hypothetical protein
MREIVNCNNSITPLWASSPSGILLYMKITSLVGSSITKIREMNEKEMESNGLDSPALVIELSCGSKLFSLRDEEGNGPGVLVGEQKRQQFYVKPT